MIDFAETMTKIVRLRTGTARPVILSSSIQADTLVGKMRAEMCSLRQRVVRNWIFQCLLCLLRSATGYTRVVPGLGPPSFVLSRFFSSSRSAKKEPDSYARRLQRPSLALLESWRIHAIDTDTFTNPLGGRGLGE